MFVDQVEGQLSAAFTDHGIRLRNVARYVGDIAIQDVLGEDLTQILLPLLRLGATDRSPENWNAALRDLQFLEAVDPADEIGLARLQERLQAFIRRMRHTLARLQPHPNSAMEAATAALEFIGRDTLRQAFPAYQREADFERVWTGFTLLLEESLNDVATWAEALDEFDGRDQVALMTIHKSKGLEFHTMIFYGLDNRTWRSLTPENTEELNSFFVAFTRAKQRAFFTLCMERGRPIAWIEDLLAPVGVHRINAAQLLT
jgi:superfamily I DNA/RNA helicase